MHPLPTRHHPKYIPVDTCPNKPLHSFLVRPAVPALPYQKVCYIVPMYEEKYWELSATLRSIAENVEVYRTATGIYLDVTGRSRCRHGAGVSTQGSLASIGALVLAPRSTCENPAAPHCAV
jgi:hypothetical protein